MTKDWQTPQPASWCLKNMAQPRKCLIDEVREVQSLAEMPYGEYLQTDHWKLKREQALWAAQYRCLICNSESQLQVHHRTYERRGCELASDLTVLCEDCHTIFHANRTLSED